MSFLHKLSKFVGNLKKHFTKRYFCNIINKWELYFFCYDLTNALTSGIQGFLNKKGMIKNCIWKKNFH